MKKKTKIIIIVLSAIFLIFAVVMITGYLYLSHQTIGQKLNSSRIYIKVDKEEFQKQDWKMIEGYFERSTNASSPNATIKFKSGEKIKIRYDSSGRYEEYYDKNKNKYYITPLIDIQSKVAEPKGLALCRIENGDIKLATKKSKPIGINGIE